MVVGFITTQYLCKQCLSPLALWVRISTQASLYSIQLLNAKKRKQLLQLHICALRQWHIRHPSTIGPWEMSVTIWWCCLIWSNTLKHRSEGTYKRNINIIDIGWWWKTDSWTKHGILFSCFPLLEAPNALINVTSILTPVRVIFCFLLFSFYLFEIFPLLPYPSVLKFWTFYFTLCFFIFIYLFIQIAYYTHMGQAITKQKHANI